jgi:hypothetical protein
MNEQPNMSESLIASLNQRVSELTNEVATLRAESKNRRLARKEALAEVDALKAQLAAVEAERDKLATSTGSGDTAKRIAELEAEVRRRDHRDVWSKALDGKLHEKASIEDVWAKTGYTPGEAVPSPETIEGMVGKALEAAPYLFATDQSGSERSTNGTAAKATPPPPGTGRAAPGTSAGRVTYTRADITQPGWQQSRPELVEALQKGAAVLVS